MSDNPNVSVDQAGNELLRRLKDDQTLETIIHRLPPEELEQVFNTFSDTAGRKENRAD